MVICISLNFNYLANAQQEVGQPVNSFLLSGGFSYGSTDLAGGTMLLSEYNHYLGQRWFLAFGLGASLQDGKTKTIYYDNDMNASYGDVSFITTGLQGWAQAGIAVIRSRRHELQVKAGPMIRYQVSNNLERLGIELSIFEVWSDDMPACTLSIGGIGGISYAYTFTNQVFINLQGGLHYDANDDGFHFVLIGVGKRFGK